MLLSRKDVLGYEGLYKVSEIGLVVNNSEHILKPAPDKDGYLELSLCKEGVRTNFKVHRLVAKAYLPNPNNLPEVNHIDEDKTNNSVDNLEWCTRQKNAEHTLAKHYKFISPEGEVVSIYNLTKFSRENNLSQGNMSEVALGKRKSHHGWKLYIDKEIG
jgi:hypothetical protein